MTSLSKIIFINSANGSIRYAEVELDGNVHFIGTQGVGKSTLLRAILFFYNADKLRLGIPKEKKTFDEHYFPYPNSYIIYEVMKDTGSFCILAFKSQGRVAFRFFDAAYSPAFFIDSEGMVFATWDKTRDIFGKHINYTKIINSYEEYRNILYGNNKGLPPEYRKYAILESKQYQNIPRTIQNVFLNAKLDAEFIKETIIKSLNEEETTIDLTTYSHTHLKDFEANLNDIRLWTDKNRNAENQLHKQANAVSTVFLALRYLNNQKNELAGQLGWSLANMEVEQPKYAKEKRQREDEQQQLQERLYKIGEAFKEKEGKINKELNIIDSKLKEIRTKQTEYKAIDIETIIAKVARKDSWVAQQQQLEQEKTILTSNFMEIDQRYSALLQQLENSLASFANEKQTEKNNGQSQLNTFKERLGKQYEGIYEEIRSQQTEALATARVFVDEKNSVISSLKIKLAEARHKRHYENEIKECEADIAAKKASIAEAQHTIRQNGEICKNTEREWGLEETKTKADFDRNIDKQNEALEKYKQQAIAIDLKIENSKDSLYGWLNEQMLGWENNIGKIIDEENVLFHPGLSPQKATTGEANFYGVNIDLVEISKTVKTVADYQREKEGLNEAIAAGRKNIASLDEALNDNLEKLKKKFQPKIRELKESIQTEEYGISQSQQQLDSYTVQLADWNKRAETEKKEALQKIENAIAEASEALIKAKENLAQLEGNINKQIDAKKKEKESKIKVEEKKLAEIVALIDNNIREKRIEIEKRAAELKAQQKAELDNKGADTKRISQIETALAEIKKELAYIDANLRVVYNYEKDKSELFDHLDEFKIRKKLAEDKLETELANYNKTKGELQNSINETTAKINRLANILNAFQEDVALYEEFKRSKAYQPISNYIDTFSEANKTSKRCKAIIEELTQKYYDGISRTDELKEAINKFAGNFQENNIFNFKTKFSSEDEYFAFAELLKIFMEEDKIGEYVKRVQERFAHIIRQIGKETNELIAKEGEIHGVITDINKDFVSRNFVGAIKRMELRTVKSANKIFQLLEEIKIFNDENAFELGQPNLFSSGNQASKNEKAISLLKQLIKEMSATKEKKMTLSDSFELQFRIVENDNDTDWVEKLSNVGSDGTDVLVKAMINIMLLNVFKERASKKQKDDFILHCMMDEIGKLHPTNVKGILKFANDRNIYLINSSPTSYNAIDYKYTYLLAKDAKNATLVKRLVKKI
ncbi:ATP-binding protein [Parasediminibacterium sp. JCM 36343]|uniref:ATP-binding protein n=1 Tax=Parasediminibacterium sp. JCM 36343 TaxID=3374279 RepID=UPI00397CAEF2